MTELDIDSWTTESHEGLGSTKGYGLCRGLLHFLSQFLPVDCEDGFFAGNHSHFRTPIPCLLYPAPVIASRSRNASCNVTSIGSLPVGCPLLPSELSSIAQTPAAWEMLAIRFAATWSLPSPTLSLPSPQYNQRPGAVISISREITVSSGTSRDALRIFFSGIILSSGG
jgi:hypothetical protein